MLIVNPRLQPPLFPQGGRDSGHSVHAVFQVLEQEAGQATE